MNYIKGTYIKNIYNNKENGYTVGIMKIKETDLDIIESTVYFTGTFYEKMNSLSIDIGQFSDFLIKKYCSFQWQAKHRFS